MKFKFVPFLFTLGALFTSCLFGQEIRKPDAQSTTASGYVADRRFDPARNASADIEQAIAEARKTGKRILLDVGGDWCPWCHALDQFFLEQPSLHQLREANFILVKVYYGEDKKNEQTLSRYSKVVGIPHFFILDATGNLLYSQHVVELRKDGVYDSGKMREFLTKWSSSAPSDVGKVK